MKYQMKMLQNALLMKKHSQTFSNNAKKIAFESYNTLNWKGGTLGQIQAIEEQRKLADQCYQIYHAVKSALELVPSRYRVLLIAIYFKKISCSDLADKYGVTCKTVYNKLVYARNYFNNALLMLGYTEQWFDNNYSQFNFEA